jgi:hypothetical protein
MTLTSNQVSPIVDKPGVDQRPGTSDIAWAERAYRHQRKEPANERPKVPRSRRRRLRILVATITIVVLMVGLVVAIRYAGSSPVPVTHQPTSSQTVTGPQPTTVTSPFTLTPPLVRPFPTLTPKIDTSKW